MTRALIKTRSARLTSRSKRSGEAHRVALVTQWYPPEQSVRVPSSIAEALRCDGLECTVLTGFPNYPSGKLHADYVMRAHETEDIDNITVHRYPLYPYHGTSVARRFVNYATFALSVSILGLRELRAADVVLVYSSPATAAMPAMVARLVFGRPFVLLIQDLWPDSVLESSLAKKMRFRPVVAGALHRACDLSYRLAAEIAVISPGMRDRLADRGVPPDKIRWIPNWADENIYRPREHFPVRSADGEFILTYAGNVGEAQDLGALLEAAACLEGHPIKIQIIGSGIQENELRLRAKQLALKNVHFLGQLSPLDTAAELNASHAQYISLAGRPIFDVTLPSKIQAALAMNHVIVGVVGGDAARLLAQSGAAMIVQPGSPETVASAILRLSRKPDEKLAEMGDRGRQFYEKCCSRNTGSSRLATLLRDAYILNSWDAFTPTPPITKIKSTTQDA